MSHDVAIAQIITAITTIFYAAVFAIGYYLLIKGNRQTLSEMREQRISGGRPQVIIEARYHRLPMVDLVVRNFGGGAARNITFAFSNPIEDSTGFILSELPFFEEGMSFLSPGEEIVCAWDNLDSLASFLREKGHNGGILVTVRYEDLAEEAYETGWRINPRIYEHNRHVPPPTYLTSEGLLTILARVSENQPRGGGEGVAREQAHRALFPDQSGL